MPKVIETTVYTIDELSGAAKENARIWYRDQGMHDEWYDFVYEDFETICKILGVTLATTPVRLYAGGTREKSQVWFTGFWNQGDGASFAGRYSYARGAGKAIRAHAPRTRSCTASQMSCRPSRGAISSRYTAPSGSRAAIATNTPWRSRSSATARPGSRYPNGAEDAVIEALRDLARWLYRQLRSEYEHQTSDDAVDEIVSANAWTFTADGKRFGLIRPA